VCSAKIQASRRGDLDAAFAWWVARGGRIAFMTLTLAHKRGQRLRTLWDGVSYCWGRVTSGGRWKATQRAYGSPWAVPITTGAKAGGIRVGRRLPYVKLSETTYGFANGWHSHLHVALLLPGDVDDRSVSMLGDELFTAWRDASIARGLGTPSRKGFDIHLVEGGPGSVAEYLGKGTYDLALELSSSATKEVGSTRPPFALLADVVERGDMDDVHLWHEWEAASRGRRQLIWSAGLRLAAGLLEERTDEEIAAEDEGGDAEHVIDPATWRAVRRAGAECDVLDAFEVSRDTGLFLLARLASIDDAT
jgi:hypothetical protein